MSSGVKSLGSTLGNVASGGLKVFAAGIGAAATGVAALGTASVKSFAEFEQLAGGAQLMFGDAFDYISDKAQNAFSTVQMSQNEYLQQVNGFATGLKTALGGNAQAAAELADKIITAEADIVAATGNSAENVQNAFNGIMKSNYTMLDNLQIGITPTKEGMQEVIDKVNEWNASQGKATSYTIENVADCQSALIDYISMVGMSGYANAEALKTISGSTASMKAAWENLVTGIADDNADFDKLVNDFVNSVATVAELLLPRVEIALEGVGELVEQLLPVIVDRIPEIVNSVLPDLLQSGVNMLLTIGAGIVEALPALGETAYKLISDLANNITNNADVIFNSGSEILLDFALGIAEALPELIWMAVDMIFTLAEALTEPDNLENILQAGIKILSALLEGLFKALPRVIVGIGQILANIIDTFIETDWVSIGKNILEGIWDGIVSGWDWLVTNFEGVADGLVQAVQNTLMIHSPSRRFKWIGEMCIAGLDEPIEDYNPYETLQNSMKANISGLQASFAGAVQGVAGGGTTHNQTININQPISTPDELARTLRTESKYGLMTGGVAFG